MLDEHADASESSDAAPETGPLHGYRICLDVLPGDEFRVYKEPLDESSTDEEYESSQHEDEESPEQEAHGEAPQGQRPMESEEPQSITVTGIESALHEAFRIYRADPLRDDEEGAMQAAAKDVQMGEQG